MNHKVVTLALLGALCSLHAAPALADDAAKPNDLKVTPEKTDAAKPEAPATLPSTLPATQPAKATVSAEAQKLISESATAYGNLKSLQLVGVFSGSFDAAGQKSGGSIPFTASFQTPNKFRHTSKEDVLVGSTGTKAFAYSSPDNAYAQVDAPKEKVASKDLPIGLHSLLSAQDPSLRLALARDPSAEIMEDVTEAARADDEKIGDVTCPTVKLTLNDKTLLTVSLDPTTHLIRRAHLDLRAKLEARKIPNIKEAFYNVEYSTTTPDAQVKDEQFAWAPPAGAKDMKDAKGPGDESPATDLVGKDAPDFKLAGLDGKSVTRADLKGKVYILDFWATWCPPCRASLPHLSELNDAEKAAGLIVYAVNLQEEKDPVEAFIAKTKLTVPVLLDSDGKAGAAFKAQAIPETVLIGKDGKVVKVVVGFDPESTPKELKAAVDEALKK